MYPSRDIGLKWVNVVSDSDADESSMTCKQVVTEAAVQRCSVKKGVLKNFAKFTRKHTESLFNKVAGLMPATLLKKRLWHRYFPVNFAIFLRTPFFIEQLWWLLL